MAGEGSWRGEGSWWARGRGFGATRAFPPLVLRLPCTSSGSRSGKEHSYVFQTYLITSPQAHGLVHTQYPVVHLPRVHVSLGPDLEVRIGGSQTL